MSALEFFNVVAYLNDKTAYTKEEQEKWRRRH